MKAIILRALPALLALPLAACAQPSHPARLPSPASLAASAAVAEQVRRCYRNPRVPSAGRNIVTRLFARYTADGALVGMPLLVSQQGLTSDSRPYAPRRRRRSSPSCAATPSAFRAKAANGSAATSS